MLPAMDEAQEGESGGGFTGTLGAAEARVLGCLLEKARTTPDHYPLTMNSLMAACNQKSNRNPVVDFGEGAIDEALASLRQKGLALRVTSAGSRVPKFEHCIDRALPGLGERETALLTVLLLRGRQTLGELRTRTERMFHFPSLEEAQSCLDDLVCFPARQLVREIPAGGGHRVPTYVQLLEAETESEAESEADTAEAGPATTEEADVASPDEEWKRAVELEIAGLRKEVEELREELDALRRPAP